MKASLLNYAGRDTVAVQLSRDDLTLLLAKLDCGFVGEQATLARDCETGVRLLVTAETNQFHGPQYDAGRRSGELVERAVAR